MKSDGNETPRPRIPRDGTAPPLPENRLMRVDEVASMLGISGRSVWRLIASGEFPNRVKIRRCVRLPKNDVQVFIEKSKQNHNLTA